MRYILILGLLSLAGCTNSYVVTQHGGMRDALRNGNTQARITFEEVNATPNAFGVGALTHLDGEVTIFKGDVYSATTSDGTTAVTKINDAQYDSATLLSLSHVDSWNQMKLSTELPLEEAIELAAAMFGIDTNEPFPFFITGAASEYHIHVINGYCPVANPDLASKYQPWRQTNSKSEDITVVGFYAKDQEGRMTHHGSNVHIHGIMDIDGVLTTGHLDSVELEDGAVIFVPAN
jgi:alpha-acetolactate decarboxylase